MFILFDCFYKYIKDRDLKGKSGKNVNKYLVRSSDTQNFKFGSH